MRILKKDLFRVKIKIQRDTFLTLVSSFLFLVPVWSVELLPMGDLGHHIAVAKILKDYHHSPAIMETFVFTEWYSTNSTCYYLLSLLYYFFNAETSARIVVSIYIIGLPLSFLYMIKSMGAPPWLGILSVIFLMNHNFTHGYLNFLLAMPLFFLLVGLHIRFFKSFSWGKAILCTLLLMLLYWTHLQVFLLMLMTLGALTFFTGRAKWHEYFLRLLPPFLSTIPFFVWFTRSLIRRIKGFSGGSSIASIFKASYLDPRDLLGQIFNEPHHVRHSKLEGYIFLFMIAMMVLLMVIAFLRGEKQNRPLAPPFTLFATLLLGLFLCPMHFHFEWDLATRLISFVWLGGIALFSYRLPEKSARILLTVLFIAFIIDIAWLTIGFVRFQRQVQPVKEMSKLIQSKSKIYRALFVPNDQSVMFNGGVYWHLDKYLMAWKDTINEDILPGHPSCIFQFREGKRLPSLNIYRLQDDPNLKIYDYIVTFSAPQQVIESAGNSRNLEVLFEKGKWGLLRVRHN